MLSDKFLARLEESFPFYYERVDAEAAAEAERLLAATGGDVEKALVRARFEGAGRLWWPYVKGSMPFVRNDRAAMESFSRLVLTVDHLVGHQPASMQDARAQVLDVLRKSVDVERLKRLLEKDSAAPKAAGAAGLVAGASALLGPIQAVRTARSWSRFAPRSVKIGIGAILAAALLSVPLIAGYSAGQNAERAAREADARPSASSNGPSRTARS